VDLLSTHNHTVSILLFVQENLKKPFYETSLNLYISDTSLLVFLGFLVEAEELATMLEHFLNFFIIRRGK